MIIFIKQLFKFSDTSLDVRNPIKDPYKKEIDFNRSQNKEGRSQGLSCKRICRDLGA